MSKKTIIEAAVVAVTGIVANEKIQKSLFGTYSDGTARSLSDCLDGEILSPKDRQKMMYGKKKKSKNKRKKGKIKL